MKRKDENLKIPGAIFPLLRIFEHQGENCWGGVLQPLLWRTRVNRWEKDALVVDLAGYDNGFKFVSLNSCIEKAYWPKGE